MIPIIRKTVRDEVSTEGGIPVIRKVVTHPNGEEKEPAKPDEIDDP